MVVFDLSAEGLYTFLQLYDTKIGIIYYYAIHNTIESKITCFEHY